MALETTPETGEVYSTVEDILEPSEPSNSSQNYNVAYMCCSSRSEYLTDFSKADKHHIYLENPSIEAVEEELNDVDDITGVVFSPYTTSSLLESHIGQYDIGLYDEEDVPQNPALPEGTVQGLGEVAEFIDGLDIGYGIIETDVYERENDPQYLRYTDQQISDQVMDKLCGLSEVLEPKDEFREGCYRIIWS